MFPKSNLKKEGQKMSRAGNEDSTETERIERPTRFLRVKPRRCEAGEKKTIDHNPKRKEVFNKLTKDSNKPPVSEE